MNQRMEQVRTRIELLRERIEPVRLRTKQGIHRGSFRIDLVHPILILLLLRLCIGSKTDAYSNYRAETSASKPEPLLPPPRIELTKLRLKLRHIRLKPLLTGAGLLIRI